MYFFLSLLSTVCKYLCKLVNIRKIDALGGNVCFQVKTLRVILIVKAAVARCNNCSVFKNNISAISGVGIGGIFLVELQLEEGVRKLDPVLSFVAVFEVIISFLPRQPTPHSSSRFGSQSESFRKPSFPFQLSGK